MIRTRSTVFIFSIILCIAAVPVAKHIYTAVAHVAQVLDIDAR